ncbi:endonuclease/exonuclease/phosphatase family protein [Sphingomonas qilianensis]|uniref:Endonuclease/exonuclease/phosphatase family protein n=1 Tax=Sphingomonas qilianensis TaxID=1736690 RepID=A0ABU9XQV7_9SPHN
MLRLASYNVENLFERAKILNRNEWIDPGSGTDRRDAARQLLDDFAKFNALLAKEVYSDTDKVEIVALLEALGLGTSDESQFVILRRNRRSLVKRTGGEITVIADGRDDWIGWLELKTEALNEKATQNTARIIGKLRADIMVVVEAEHRPSLLRFNQQVIAPVAGWSFDHIALIDGNDERGIDVGVLTREPHALDFVRTHVDDTIDGKRVFSRDCPEFHFALGDSRRLVILANHLKSKGYGFPAENDATRKRQATRIREIYQGLRTAGNEFVAILGDLNDSPGRDPLSPLLGEGSDLRDVSEVAGFDNAGRPGTFGNCTASDKIDYILMSPALFALAHGGGIDRSGVWGGTNGTLFPHIPEITKATEAASDHAAIFVDLDL